MTKEDIRKDFVKNAKSSKFVFRRKKHMGELFDSDKELRLAIYKKLFLSDAIKLETYEELLRGEGYEAGAQ